LAEGTRIPFQTWVQLQAGPIFAQARGYRIAKPQSEEIMKTITALLLALALLPSTAHAQMQHVPIAGVCGWDIQQYCKGINPRRTRELKECLGKHEKDLYPRCRDHYKEGK
jgi:hypothetical protein